MLKTKDLEDIKSGKYDHIYIYHIESDDGEIFPTLEKTYYMVGKNKWLQEWSAFEYDSDKLISEINEDVDFWRKGDYGCKVIGLTKDGKKKTLIEIELPKRMNGYRTAIPKLNVRKMF